MSKGSRDVHLDPHVTPEKALLRLTNRMNGCDVERRIQIRSAEEQQRSALHVERRLHERIDEIQSISPLIGAQVSLESELRRLSQPLRRQCHAQRSAKFDVRFGGSQPD